jgi:hypothetical protein
MKLINAWLFVLALTIFCSCNWEPSPAASPSPLASASPVKFSAEDIKAIVAGNEVAKYRFKDRGPAPLGYLQGLAIVFARSVCDETAPHVLAATQPLGPVVRDAMTWYGLEPSLVNVYALLYGLGMRESSGQYCEGRDVTAQTATAEEAEAGLFQTSYNSRYSNPPAFETPNPVLVGLINRWKSDESKGLLEVFKQGVSCGTGDATNFGSGAGRDFQALSKRCPAFVTEYAAVMVRVNGGSKGHYGPLRRKEAEVLPFVVSMLKEIEAKVRASGCKEI